MSYALAEVLDVTERLWPHELCQEWDRSGLVSGRPDDRVSRVLLAVDAVDATVSEAVECGAQLLLVHHPLLLRGVSTVAETSYKGELLARLIRAGCALTTAHTNADAAVGGVSDVLARRLGLTRVRPLDDAGAGTGVGRVGVLAEPTSLESLARRLAQSLPTTATGVRLAGRREATVTTVAVCGGAGDAYLGHPEVLGADVYITSDLRHHPASEARESARVAGGPALLDVSHWASESLWLDDAAQALQSALPGLETTVSTICTDPWDLVVAS